MTKRENDENRELHDSEKKKVKLNDEDEKDIKISIMLLKEIEEKNEKELFLKSRDSWVCEWRRRWECAEEFQTLGDTLYEQGNFKKAKKYYERAVKFDSLNTAHYDNLGLTLTDLKEHEKAIKSFKKGLKYSPDDFYSNYNCGRTFNMMKRYNEAIPYFQAAIKADPYYGYAYIALGNSYSGLSRYEDANEITKRAIEVSPDLPNSYANIGENYLQLGKIEEAIEYFKREIEVAPESARAYFKIGSILDDKKKYDEAITYYKKGIEIRPEHVSAYHNLGITYRKIRDYENAIEQFKEVAKREPESANGYYILGEVFYFAGRYKEAFEQHEKAKEKLLIVNSKTNIFLHTCTSFPLIKLKEYEKAKIEIQSYITNPDESFDLFCYGFVLYKLKEYQSAYETLLRCILIGTVKYNDEIEYRSKTKYYLAMTLIKLQENNYDKIMQNFEDAIVAQPNWGKAYYRIAQFLTMKYPLEKKAEIKSNYLIAVEKNNLMHPCDRLSELKIMKIMETLHNQKRPFVTSAQASRTC